jgi:hypothetical protein
MKKVLWIVGMIVLGFVFVIALGAVTMGLWNWLVPELFAGPTITFWQALGLFILSKILFGGFGKGGSHRSGPWKNYWKEKWSGMTPEERETFKRKMKDKWCSPSPARSEQE